MLRGDVEPTRRRVPIGRYAASGTRAIFSSMVDVAQGKPCPSGSRQEVPQSPVDDRRGLSSAEISSILSGFPRPLWTRVSDALADMRFGSKRSIYPPLQLRPGGVALPEITLTNGRRQIRLIGVMHLADRAVWNALNVLLSHAIQDSADIHFEAIRPVRKLNQDEIQAQRRHRAFHRYLGLAFGMQYQTDAIAPQRDWVHADLTDKELSAIADIRLGEFPDGVGSVLARLSRLPFMRSQRGRRIALLAVLSVVQSIPWFSGNADSIVAARNRVAVRTALTNTSSHIISVWGAAHLPGIARLLTEAGWSVTRSGSWITIPWNEGGAPRRHPKQIQDKA